MFAQGFINAGLGVIYFAFLSRALSGFEGEMGVYAILVFLVSLPSSIGVFALPSAAVRYVAKYQAEKDSNKARAVVVRIMQIGVLSSIVTFVVLFVPAEWLSSVMLGTSSYALLLRLIAVASVFNIFYVIISAFLQGLQKMAELATIGLIYTFVSNILGVYLIFSGWRLYAVAYSWVVAFSSASIIGLILIARHVGIWGKPHEIKPLFKFSMPLYVSGAVGYFVGWVDQLILVSYMSLLYGAAEAQNILGIYYVAVRASLVTGLFASSIVTALFPHLSELYARNGSDSLRDAFRVSTRYSVLIGFPLIVGLATLAYPVILLFSGTSYVQATMPLIIISIATAAATIGVAISPILMTIERTTAVSILSVISIALSTFLSYFALAYLNLGMVGTAWARTFATVIGLVLNLYVLSRYVPISIDTESLWKASAASVFLVLSIIGLDLARKSLFVGSYQFLVIGWRLLPIYVVVGAVGYFVALIALKGIKKHDVKLVEEYLPKRLRRFATWIEKIAVND